MENNREKQTGNPHENNLNARLKEKRIAAVRDRANEDFKDKKVSESLMTSYEVANISSYIIDLFSIATGSFAIFYLLHDQFGSLSLTISYGVAAVLGVSIALLLQVGKRQNLKILLPYLFKYKRLKKAATLVQIPLAAASIALTFYCCSVFPNFISEAKGLEDLATIKASYQVQLDSVNNQISLVSSGLTYKTGGKKGEVKTGASRLLKTLNENKKTIQHQKIVALSDARVRNEGKIKVHQKATQDKGYLLGWISVFAELLAYLFCVGFCYWFEYILTEEDEAENEDPPNNTRSNERGFQNLLDDALNTPQNTGGDTTFFRNGNHNTNTQNAVITSKNTAFKLAITHQKDNGDLVEYGKDVVATRIRGYSTRVAEKIEEIRSKGYTPNRGKELFNRYDKLDYWSKRQTELINLYDENLERV